MLARASHLKCDKRHLRPPKEKPKTELLCAAPLVRWRIRIISSGIANIDAPEMPGSTKCPRGRNGWCDYPLAVQSRDALQGLLSSGTVAIIRQGQDAYGRTLARVSVNGRDAGQYLVRQGLARPWR